MSNDDLAAVILPWAKAAHPEKYEATVGVSPRPQAFRRYLLRLIEIRWEEDPAWRHDAPLRALEETSIVQRMRLAGGAEIVVKGKRAGGEREWTWAEFADLLEAGHDINVIARAKAELDLVVDDGQFKEARRHRPRRRGVTDQPSDNPAPTRRGLRPYETQTKLSLRDRRREI